MRGALILSLVIAVAAVIFAIQNPGSVELALGPTTTSVSKALVIIVTFGAGLLVGMLSGLPARLRTRRRIKALEQQVHPDEDPGVYGEHSGSGYAAPYEHGRLEP